MPYRDGDTTFDTYIRFQPSADQLAEVAALEREVEARLATEDLDLKKYERLDEVRIRCVVIRLCRWRVPEIAKEVDWDKQRVCRTIHSFEREGVASLRRGAGRPADPYREAEIIATLQLLREHTDFKNPAEFHAALNERIEPPISLARCRHYLRKAGIRFRKPSRSRSKSSL